MKPIFWALPLLALLSCGPSERWLNMQAPENFRARFETTKGAFIAEFDRSLSPEAVDRVYQLIRTGFFEEVYIFRVVPGFVAQFGIHTDSTLNHFWRSHPLPDEPVAGSNRKGTIAFARGGPESRSTQLFINLRDNQRLDSLEVGGVVGYPPIGRVVDGMDVVARFNARYGNQPSIQQDSILDKGNPWLEEHYPGLDYIRTAEILK